MNHQQLGTLARFVGLLVAGTVVQLITVAARADAAPACGAPLPPGSAWAGVYAALGDVMVRSNGADMGTLYDCTTPAGGSYGPHYQCTELAQRWAAVAWGEPATWMGYAYQAWAAGPTLPRPLLQHRNGGEDAPRFGDLIVFDHRMYNSAGVVVGDDVSGHIAVVSAVTASSVTIVEQNWNANGGATLPMRATTVQPRQIYTGKYLHVLGWLRPRNTAAVAVRFGGTSGYTVRSDGLVRAFGGATDEHIGSTWPGLDLTRGIALRSDGKSGYVLDRWGGLHPFGGAPAVAAPEYWKPWDIARGLVLRADGVSGYVLDGYGGLHEFGGAPRVTDGPYWNGWDVARGIALRSDGRSGYVVDAYGGISPFGGAPKVTPSAYWNGNDVARGIAVLADGFSGYVVDREGGVHPFGDARSVAVARMWPGMDVARGIAVDRSSGRGAVVGDDRVAYPFAPKVTCTTCA
jgi:hypothetical protein